MVLRRYVLELLSYPVPLVIMLCYIVYVLFNKNNKNNKNNTYNECIIM
jgi:hypothetical protein